ncbi:HAMP domain-containing protein [Micromonospora zingiberis]|uniref:HAMP domain-containing protein n=1 Tax=Micromonospora zingiberis TaxID=2053011 RepID=A0A4R0G3L6_9ACTN|nr:cache domain-containing protein [Micromonospora zingiberis]TCB91254.1 HAMP domain-containing protein [Micromonospora zingiberis]
MDDSVHDQAQLVAWRRRALDQQLPAAAFPAGTNAPSLVYLCATMFVVVAAVLGFAVNAQQGVLPAVVDSQRDIVSKLASSIRLEVTARREELARVVQTRGEVSDADLLTRVINDGRHLNGALILETATRQVVTAKGAQLPLDLLPEELPVGSAIAVTNADGPLMVYGVALDDTRVVLATQPLTMRNLRLNPDAGHGIHALTPDGTTSLMQGANAVDAVHLPAVFDGLAEAGSRQSRQVVVKEWSDRRLLVSSAPVGSTGLVIVSLLTAEVSTGTSLSQGLALGLSLLAVGLLSFWIMRMSLVRPVRALLSQAKADACGAATTRRSKLRIREAHRIARALALTSGEQFPSDKRWRPTVLQGLGVALVVALLWPAAVVVLGLQAPAPTIPVQLMRDEENRAEEASNALGNFLDGGLATVSRVSYGLNVQDLGRAGKQLDRELDTDHRLRSLYLVDRDGTVLASAGRRPLRSVEPLPGEIGIHLDPTVQRLPVVYAYNQMADGYSVVGEFDPDRLLGLVRRVSGRAHVVDAELRTVLDSEGFRAFQPLQGDLARDAAVEALPGGTVGRSHTADGEPALVAAAGLSAPGTVAHLEWAIVIEQDTSGLRLPELVERRWTLLMAGAAMGIVLLTHVWQLYIFVRPLRRLAFFSDRMSDGTIELPVPPQRHDDIGAIAMCLEICRQVRHTGSARFGGALRLRGAGADRTKVLPRVRSAAATTARGTKG